MTLFLQACGAILIAVVLILCLGNERKDIGVVLGISVCCMLGTMGLRYLRTVIDFLDQLETVGGLSRSMLDILLKTAGIGLISEFSGLVCADSGNASLGKALKILGTAVILWLSIPLFTALLDLIQKILGGL